MMPHPTKIKSLILLIFVVFFQISCEKDTDLFLEAVLIPDNPVDIENATGNDSLVSKTIELSPTNDAYIQEGKGYDDQIIRLQANMRTSYLMFDLSSIEGEVETIDLKLTIDTDPGNGTLKIFRGTHTNWSEKQLTSNTAPAKDIEIATFSKAFETGATEDIVINKNLISKEIISLVLEQENGDDFSITSKENPNKKGPILVITYKAPNDSEPTETGTENGQNFNVPDGYFVTVNGKASNDGLSEATSWSLPHAFSTAKAGDIVYVKAGNYGSLKLASSKAGTSGSPIKFIGYTKSPGDIVATVGPTYTKDNLIADGQSLPDNIMPHLENNPSGLNPNSGDDAITITHNYIEIHNFMVSEYEIGYDVKASYVTMNNCIGFQFGNWDSKAVGWNDDSDGFDHTNRDGYAMRVTNNSTNCTITNNLMVDGGLVNYFFIGGGSHKIDNNHGIALNSGNGSDYIFDFYNSSNNLISNTYAERSYKGTQGHRSRAMILQAVSDNNTVSNFTGVNARLQIENARNNSLTNVNIIGSGGENNGSVQIYGQANNNIFKNLTIDGGGGIAFLGYDSNEKQRTPVTSAGDNNFFINVKILNLDASNGNGIISFHRLGNSAISGGTNYIIGLTADNFNWLINANRSGTINIYNATFSDGNSSTIDTFYSGFKDGRNNYKVNFTNTNFAPSNKFKIPSGTKIISVPPLFTNEASKDYTLQSGSQLIGAGVNPSNIFSNFNVDISTFLKPSGASYNIGAD